MATIDAAVTLFRHQDGGGQIVGIGSVAGVRGLPGSGSYSASKAAIATYLEAVRAETYGEPITVTTLAPGYIDTPINQDMKSRPFLIDAEKGARIMADLIERGVGYATVPRMPWTVIAPLLRVLPTSLLARSAPRRNSATGH
jgi:short-subunit dehydrogenase